MVVLPISTVETILDEYINTSKLKVQKPLKLYEIF